jgi:hypothetical protein
MAPRRAKASPKKPSLSNPEAEPEPDLAQLSKTASQEANAAEDVIQNEMRQSLVPSQFLPSWAVLFTIPLAQGIVSAVLYTILEPWNSQHVVGLVDSSSRIWAFDVTRLVLPAWLALANDLDGNSPNFIG